MTLPIREEAPSTRAGAVWRLGRTTGIIAMKDLRTEFRRFYEVFSILAFAAGSMLISGLVLQNTQGTFPAVILWITLFFVTILIFTTSFTREADRGTLGGLKSLPGPPMAILAGKTLYGTILVVSMSLVLFGFSMLFQSLNPAGELSALLIVYILGALGLSFAGSFVSGLVMYSEEKTMLLSFLLLPICVPVLVPAVTATEKLVEGGGLSAVIPELRLLIAFLLLITALMILTFTYLMEE